MSQHLDRSKMILFGQQLCDTKNETNCLIRKEGQCAFNRLVAGTDIGYQLVIKHDKVPLLIGKTKTPMNRVILCDSTITIKKTLNNNKWTELFCAITSPIHAESSYHLGCTEITTHIGNPNWFAPFYFWPAKNHHLLQSSSGTSVVNLLFCHTLNALGIFARTPKGYTSCGESAWSLQDSRASKHMSVLNENDRRQKLSNERTINFDVSFSPMVKTCWLMAYGSFVYRIQIGWYKAKKAGCTRPKIMTTQKTKSARCFFFFKNKTTPRSLPHSWPDRQYSDSPPERSKTSHPFDRPGAEWYPPGCSELSFCQTNRLWMGVGTMNICHLKTRSTLFVLDQGHYKGNQKLICETIYYWLSLLSSCTMKCLLVTWPMPCKPLGQSPGWVFKQTLVCW